MTDNRDHRRRTPAKGISVQHLTPPDGVPTQVDPETELSTPIIVPLPAMSRAKTPTDRPRMTEDEYRLDLTANRHRIEREQELLSERLSESGKRIGEHSESLGRHDERLKTLEADRGEFASIAEFREWTVKRITSVTGVDGTNGAHGALKARVDASDAHRKMVIGFVLGLVITAGSAVAWATSNVADLRARLSHVESTITDFRSLRRNQPQPAMPAEKISP